MTTVLSRWLASTSLDLAGRLVEMVRSPAGALITWVLVLTAESDFCEVRVPSLNQFLSFFCLYVSSLLK